MPGGRIGRREVPKTAELTVDDMRKGAGRLRRRISELEVFRVEDLCSADDISDAATRFEVSIGDTITQTFGVQTVEAQRYAGACFFHRWSLYTNAPTPFDEMRSAFVDARREALNLLGQALSSLEERIEVSESDSVVPSTITTQISNRKVFVVHGHDEAARNEVARTLEAGDFQPIILNEQPNRGMSIIEKIEAYDRVGFAVVLLTPDDVGGQAGEEMMPRARQNVVFELGYFIKGLGRSRVCALKKGDIEVPSDYLGVVWVDMDEPGAWKMTLAHELDAAGFEVDYGRMSRPSA